MRIKCNTTTICVSMWLVVKINNMPDQRLGLLPLAIYAAHFRHNMASGRGVDSLWICHIAVFLSGVGLIFRKRSLLRTACIWLVIGLPCWIFDMIITGQQSITSFLSHIGGLAISIFSVWRIGLDHHDWARATTLFLVLQQACRNLIPPDLNVNIAFAIRPEAKGVFTDYRSYWLATTLCMIATTYGINRSLMNRLKQVC
ncbi:MAG: hypothetical protein HQM09_13315 [Candidatus Riflebacteria bacterium]|nr:hypothetical protein [Candidatus Riflebacteria bacterium]